MTLNELKAKYGCEAARQEPKPDCIFCHGAGERPIRSRPHELTFCICLYVDHSASDEMGTMLGKIASDHLDNLKSRPPALGGRL